MYTTTFIDINIEQDRVEEITENISKIYSKYNDLTTKYQPLDENSPFINNIFSINLNFGKKIEIDKELYDLLLYCKEIENKTDGYFNIKMGDIIEIWKNLIQESEAELRIGDNIFVYQYLDTIIMKRFKINSVNNETISLENGDAVESYQKNDLVFFKEISSIEYQENVDRVNEINIDNSSYVLESNGYHDKTYYITTQGQRFSFDIDAISKGYANKIVEMYLRENGILNFSINSGNSSISLGENINRPEENNQFIVSIKNPFNYGSNKTISGTFKIKNNNISTTGNYEQFRYFNGKKISHIISPINYLPVDFYGSITVIGEDSSLIDALSTAFYSMPPEKLEYFLTQEDHGFQIEVIIVNNDGMVDTFLTKTNFEEFNS
jgi:thiamine biosynthesis lipoprotein